MDRTLEGKRVIILGATGMIGNSALHLCLDDQGVSRVTVIGRRSIGLDHPGLVETVHENFLDYRAVADSFRDQDVALFCLGAYTGTVPDDEFRRITVDYTAAFARSLHEESPGAAFCFLSGQGADQTGASRVSFARYKGEAEKVLIGLGFPRLHIFRPGYIYPVERRAEPNLMYRIMRMLYPVARRIYPNIGITSEDLARSMVEAGLHGDGDQGTPILENRDIRSVASMVRHWPER